MLNCQIFNMQNMMPLTKSTFISIKTVVSYRILNNLCNL